MVVGPKARALTVEGGTRLPAAEAGAADSMVSVTDASMATTSARGHRPWRECLNGVIGASRALLIDCLICTPTVPRPRVSAQDPVDRGRRPVWPANRISAWVGGMPSVVSPYLSCPSSRLDHLSTPMRTDISKRLGRAH